MSPVLSVQLGMIGTSSSVPCHYPGTLPQPAAGDLSMMWELAYTGSGHVT